MSISAGTRRRFLTSMIHALATAGLSPSAFALDRYVDAALASLGGRIDTASPAPQSGSGTLATSDARHRAFPWPFDVNGDGRLDDADHDAVVAALGRARGAGTSPRAGVSNADPFGVGSVDPEALRALDRLIAEMGTAARALPPRPLVLAWHYGWYRGRRREPVTVRSLEGSYLSSDDDIEARFNGLKNEFGISVDMVSWVDDSRIFRDLARGYLHATSRGRRRFGLLYESTINLGTGTRMEFPWEGGITAKLVADFEAMARTFALEPGRLRPDVFVIDGRPVVYLFASHLFGKTNRNLIAAGRALERARAAFERAAGTSPYLIGDEALFPVDESVGTARLFRAAHFDAITRYHHYDETQVRRMGEGNDIRMDSTYLRLLLDLERRTMAGFAQTRNRFTGAPLLVIPSSAAGFAKHRLPRLMASREDYEALLIAMWTLTTEHLSEVHRQRLGTPALPAPLVIVGSWNEEYEGHALMPAAMNRAVHEPRQGGFDWLYAIKSLYGWNHHAIGNIARPAAE